MFWNRYPIARILLPFLSGICVVLFFDLKFLFPFYIFLILVLAILAVVLFFQKKLSYRMRWITGVVITVFFLLAGYQLTALKNNSNNNFFFGKFNTDENYILVSLTEPVQVKEKICKCVVEVKAVNDSIQWLRTSGKAVLYIEKDTFSENLNYGDEVLLKCSLKELTPPLNPGEFNYRNYLKYRTIDYNAFVKKNYWKLISSDNGNPLFSFAFNLRAKLLTILKNNGLEGNEYAVVSALLVGFTDNLDPDLIKDYQGSGAVHILSVSGLHVGIIFLVLNFLLKFLDKTKFGRFPKAFLLLLFIWFYAVLTGMSPSVLRATAMFSFVVLGNVFRQPPNIYNTLAASAMILLFFDPYMITAVGFQLSYLAVLGIVVVYPYLKKAWTPRIWLFREFWSLIAVSLAAQLITFPLCLFYFHQFPNYFLLTNIVAVPLSGLVIYIGIAVLLLSFFPWLAFMLSKALIFSLKLLNGSISFIEGLPYSVSRSIPIDFVGMLLIYIIIIAFLIFLVNQNKKALIGAMSFLFLLVAFVTVRSQQSFTQQKIVVYNINKHTAIDFISGKRTYFLCDSALAADTGKQEFHIFNNRCRQRIKEVFPVMISVNNDKYFNDIFYYNSNFYAFLGRKLAIINNASYNKKNMPVDFLIVSGTPDITVSEMLTQYKPGMLIFDASSSLKSVGKWIKECEKNSIAYYNTRQSGAWEYDLKTDE